MKPPRPTLGHAAFHPVIVQWPDLSGLWRANQRRLLKPKAVVKRAKKKRKAL